MRNATRIERLKNLRRVLRTIDRAQKQRKKAKIGTESIMFDMSTWMSHDCGTSCCAFGACALDPWFKRRGLDAGAARRWGSPIYKQRVGGIAAQLFFGITYMETCDIFLNTHSKASEVIDVVNRTIRRYSRKEAA